MHVTSTERAGNGERERVPPGCTSIRVFLSLDIYMSLSLSLSFSLYLYRLVLLARAYVHTYGIRYRGVLRNRVRREVRHCVGDQTNEHVTSVCRRQATLQQGCAEGAQGARASCATRKIGTHERTGVRRG